MTKDRIDRSILTFMTLSLEGVWYCCVLIWRILRIPTVEVILPRSNEVIPHRNGCVSWECLWRSQWWPRHWFAVLHSPLAWPWLEEQTRTHTKAQLRPLTSSVLGKCHCLLQASPWQTLHRLYGAILVTWTGPDHRIFTLLYCRPQSSCDKRIGCSHIQIEAGVHAEPHTICHMAQYFWS